MRSAIIQMGKAGDICNILPLAKIVSEQDGEHPTLFVQDEFRSILEGVSYAVPGKLGVTDFRQIEPTLKKRFDRVLNTTVCGEGIAYQRRCESFTKEAWDRAGMLDYFGKNILDFDRRSKLREERLCHHFIRENRRTMLVNLTGASSPYPRAAEVLDELWRRYSHQFEIVNLAGVRAERFYDLLGLYDRAQVLVTADTGTLHLAAARPGMTVLALKTDSPTLWHGSVPQVEPAVTVRYGESLEPIYEFLNEHGWAFRPKVAHVYSRYPMFDSALRRHELARKTWVVAGVPELPVADARVRTMFDGRRTVPYLKDLIGQGMCMAEKGILLSNTDTCFAPKLVRKIKTLGGVPMWGGRRDFKRLDYPLTQAEVEAGERYCGSDLFYIPAAWWQEQVKQFPDMVIGTEGWDCCLRELMRATGGVEMRDCCYHERHDSFWERPENRHTLRSQLHNQGLAKEFLKRMGIDPREHGFI